ncbi:hypothetical protein POTOM_050942 [Populus tomentosa]|uniref:Alkane hydroxylase MAH1-like n=1 Tax=Populus tomentosa TaxID=118781 RepID=A0A8X7YCM1_POPTO|nr:hypothetical protein POTOM_050942 [Populus tomentosa]
MTGSQMFESKASVLSNSKALGSDFNKKFDILGDGIINADRDLWKNQRKVAQALVNHRLFCKRLVKTIQDKVERGLIPVLEHVYKQSLVLDLQDLFQRFTFDATCVSFDPGCLSMDLPEVAFSKAMDNAMEAIKGRLDVVFLRGYDKIATPPETLKPTCLIFCLRKNNGPPKNWPLIGMLPGLLIRVHRFHDWVTDVLEQSKCTFQFKGPWFGDMDILVTADPANVHYIMSSNFSNFEKGSDFNKRFDILGDGIINADRDLWKNQRKVAQALVNHRLFYQRLVKTIQDKVERGLIPVLEQVYKQSLVLDLQDLFQRFTFDATCVIVTGFDPGCLSMDLPEVAFSKAIDNAMEAIFYRHVLPESTWRLQRWLGIGKEKKLKKARETLDRIIAEIISMKREELSKGNRLMDEDGEGIDLLTSYMSEDYNMGFKSEDEFLRDTIVTFMLAGRDTVSSCLSWFFWLVSKNPAAGAKIREELETTLPEKEAEKRRLFDIEKIKKLVYLHGALCESLRLYPPIHSEFKSPLRQDILPSGHRVNPKTKIVFSLYAMGRMSSVWGDDCFEFKPERWITDRGGMKHEPSYKFFSFNAGPRTCLGKDVAFTQMKAVVAAIIYNYQVQVVDEHAVTPSQSVVLHMKHGMKVKLTKRWI